MKSPGTTLVDPSLTCVGHLFFREVAPLVWSFRTPRLPVNSVVYPSKGRLSRLSSCHTKVVITLVYKGREIPNGTPKMRISNK